MPTFSSACSPVASVPATSEGKSSHKLLSEFLFLKKRYWGQHILARGYLVASSGNVTDEVWKEYIKNQRLNEPDDDFSVL